MGTQIKICGIRRKEDAEYVNEALPDYVGFIFWEKSFRNISLEEAVSLREQIKPQIPCVGVYVDESVENIMKYVRCGAIQIIQLHGHESEEMMKQLRDALSAEGKQLPIWKAFKVRSEQDLEQAKKCSAERILLDNGYGTGECFEHSLLGKFNQDYILAGGLTVDNITDVINKYHPSAIDISSGVETEKCKDREKVLRAVALARNS